MGLTLTASGAPAANLDVRVKWLSTDGYREERARSSGRGAYAFCNLIPGPALPVEVFDGRRPVLQDRVSLEPGKALWRELVVPPGTQ
jgi:hypothetical protein